MKPVLPEGAYWSEAEARYILPHETTKWRVREYQQVTGHKLPPCPCGEGGDFVLFMFGYKVGEEQGAQQITIICEACAEKAGGIAKQLNFTTPPKLG